ncbi:MAG: sulfite exporter TauE/SafE family protein [Xanthobacteraceae bacterium]
MIDLPDSAAIAAAFADRRFFAAAAVAALAGLVRGFSGFGGAMIYMALISAIYEPRIAAVTILLVDFLSSAPFAIPEFRRCTWREVIPISLAMVAAVPLGTWALIALDPVVLRWCIAVLVLSLVPILASGWRYHGAPRIPVTIAVGLFAGVSAGAVQIAGPPVILYWLSGGNTAMIVRANLMVFFLFCGIALVIAYAVEGLFTAQTLALSLLLGIPYLVGVGAGSYFFRGVSDRLYRLVAYFIIALAAIVSLPVLDQFLR